MWRDLVVLAGLRCPLRGQVSVLRPAHAVPAIWTGRPGAQVRAAIWAGGSPGWTWIMAGQCADSAESIAQMEAVLRETENVDVFLRDLAVLAARSVGEDLSCGIMLQPLSRPSRHFFLGPGTAASPAACAPPLRPETTSSNGRQPSSFSWYQALHRSRRR